LSQNDRRCRREGIRHGPGRRRGVQLTVKREWVSQSDVSSFRKDYMLKIAWHLHGGNLVPGIGVPVFSFQFGTGVTNFYGISTFEGTVSRD
jgi:hypothetical protein